MEALKITGLHKSFKDFALEDINLSLPKGMIMGLIGANGAGKTTLIKSILGLLYPDSGQVEILGTTLEAGGKKLREHIGVVPDGFEAFANMTAKEINLVMSHSLKSWDKERFYGFLKRFQLKDNKPTREFSKGMRMKLSIAIALSHDSRILILDEATSGLDPIVRDEILELFQEFVENEEHSVLISSHILSDLEKICDYITFMQNGRVVVCDSKDDLLERFVVVKCSEAELSALPEEAVKGIRKHAFGSEVLLLREAVTKDMTVDKASLEDIMLLLLKEGRV